MHLESLVPSVITEIEPKETEIEVPQFLVLKRTERFLFFRNRTSLKTEEPNRSVRLEPNAQPDPQVPPENPEGPSAAVEGEAVEQPRENRNLEDGEQGLLIPLEAHSVSEEGSPRK